MAIRRSSRAGPSAADAAEGGVDALAGAHGHLQPWRQEIVAGETTEAHREILDVHARMRSQALLKVGAQDDDLLARAGVEESARDPPDACEDLGCVHEGDGVREVRKNGVDHFRELVRVMHVPQHGGGDAADVDDHRAQHVLPGLQGRRVPGLHEVLQGEDEGVHQQRLQPFADDAIHVPGPDSGHHQRRPPQAPRRNPRAAPVAAR
eukprot:CAMPEP_0198527118 /NCGR_PEP_ID=MMETSP1462-20131121/24365_1 /TAXON_ID=1333877 /ORGANISM="Brandtodinium nutriculum, Strain RCC3387" /LENGTH=206 /DNA_ID=CAMNT_0044256911 /DNA_START=1 /DNA_END=617 /DNA_ORIENTATION=+